MTAPPAAVEHPGSAVRWSDRAWSVVPDLLAVVAEGAWVAALYALVQAAAGRPEILGPLALAAIALIGLVVARAVAPGLGPRWPSTALALVLGVAAGATLLDPDARTALAGVDPVDAIRAHPGGWLAGLALLRGIGHATPGRSAVALDTLVTVGLPGLVIPVLLAGTLPEPWRGQALAGIVAAIVIFTVAAVLGLAVTRIAAIGTAGGFDWRRNRAWLALVALLAIGIVIAALPAASVVGPVIRVASAVLFLPLLLVGGVAGMTQVSRRAVLGLLVVCAVAMIVVVVAPDRPSSSSGEGGPPPGPPVAEPTNDLVTIAEATVLAIVVLAGVVLLARLWMRETLQFGVGDVAEERMIDARPPEARDRGPGPRRRQGRATGRPPDAAGAYLALLADLDARPSVRRAAHESPAEHARRLRLAGTGATGLDLLAADYELIRFAGRGLTGGETRRAIGRWRRLRAALGRQTGRSGA